MSLEEKIYQKVENEIGELISDEELKEMVQGGIEKALFEERVEESTSSYGTKTTKKPCIVDELVDKYLEEKMRSAVEQWLADNPDKVQEAIGRAIENGVGAALMSALDRRFADIFVRGVDQMQYQGLLPDNVNFQ